MQVGTNTPISIKYNGQAIYTNMYAGWQTLAVEMVGGQNQVLWKNAGTNSALVWTMDSNWNYLYSGSTLALNSTDALAQESNFNFDLNGDGIIGSFADLVITGQTATSTVTVGGSVSVGAYTKNNGNASAGYSYVRYWLSNDTTLDSSDTSIDYQYVGALNSGSSQYNSLNFTYNSSWGTGTKYILFQADGFSYVSESNESNNLAYATIFVTSPSPDLVITGQTATNSVTVGGNVSIGAYTRNNGNASASSNYVRYWLSNDTTLDNSDTFINWQSVNSLSAGSSQYNSLNFTYNSSWGTGTKYILFQADGYGNVTESNESNNLAYATIFVASPSPDLVITGQTATSTVTVGGSVSVGASTKNNGNASAGYSYVRYWLSNDTILDGNDTSINYQYVGALNTGSSQYNSLNFTYNSSWGTGTKYILFQADGFNYVTESNESNNVAYSTIFVSSDWYAQNLSDTGIRELTRSLAADGNLNRNDMIAIFSITKDNGIVDANELTDLRTILSNSSRFGMADYVKVLSNKIANGNVANERSGIGNLYGGSSATTMENLVGKWFLGTDRPTAVVSDNGVRHMMNYTYTNGTLFGTDNTVSYTDIKQGFVGDCWFVASLAANALKRLSKIMDMFIDNSDGTFTVRLYGQTNGDALLDADYVTVNRDLPTNVAGYGSDGVFYTDQRYAYYDNNSVGLWVALAEKAYAQFAEQGITQRATANSYESIEGGWGYRGMPSISGVDGGYYADTSYSNLGSRAGVFMSLSTIANTLSSGSAMTADTIPEPSNGIVGSHEYVIINANTSTGMLTLYNPWAATQTGEANGIRTISYNDFRNNFNIINVA